MHTLAVFERLQREHSFEHGRPPLRCFMVLGVSSLTMVRGPFDTKHLWLASSTYEAIAYPLRGSSSCTPVGVDEIADEIDRVALTRTWVPCRDADGNETRCGW